MLATLLKRGKRTFLVSELFKAEAIGNVVPRFMINMAEECSAKVSIFYRLLNVRRIDYPIVYLVGRARFELATNGLKEVVVLQKPI